jgi:hypothetical protein
MSITTRQTNLLVNQDWTKLYQTFKQADFQSYDFETLRKSMIDYIKTYYPEDFNDFTESSEYVALIDLIAFLGQSLAFRADLNARENFFDTAERRDSILKLARLISYNPSRNVGASGYLKIDSVRTTENLFDSNGLNLSNLLISWNDTANPSWQEQLTTILNASLVSIQSIGKPGNSNIVNGIKTDEYSINLVPGVLPRFGFTALVENNQMDFEAVSASSAGQTYIYEPDPIPTGKFNILYKNDNLGNGSNNTGFFLYIKQGDLSTQDFNLQQSLPNRVVNVNYTNINNTDVWLYQLDSAGNPTTAWSQVPAVAGINVIYNQIANRNLFQVNSQTNDAIDLVFGDGSFANIPQGIYRLYYRTSNGLQYKVTPDEMQSITIPINYVSRNNTVETLTITASLYYTISNSQTRQLIDSIRQKAPAQYYTQNRMITGEDYNLFPYTNFSSVLKVKAVNRTSSGISRYLDVLDVTGKYSSTNIFCDDGWLYSQFPTSTINFTFTTTTDIYNTIYNTVVPLLQGNELLHYYYANFPRFSPPTPIYWGRTSSSSNSSTGYFYPSTAYATPLQIGLGVSSNLQYITTGSLIRFNAGAGKFFNAQNQITAGTATYASEKTYIWATVVSANAGFPIQLSQNLPAGAIPDTIIPVFKNALPGSTFISVMVNLLQSYQNIGLSYNISTQSWQIVQAKDLNLGAFSLTNQGDTSGEGLDSSWLISFVYNGIGYNVAYRGLQYIFQSNNETRFYFDPKVKVYDSKTGLTITDDITILKTNTQPDSANPLGQNEVWKIYNNVVNADGYIDSTQVMVTFPDSNNDGIPDDPDLFTNIVAPSVNPTMKFVFFQQVADQNTTIGDFLTVAPVDNATICITYATQSAINAALNLYLSGQIFYATSENNFYQLTVTTNGSNTTRVLNKITNYVAEVGRQNLYFQYRHASPNDRRIDPSPSNIMDLYILTSQYSQDYLSWIQDTTGSVVKPTPPTNDELATEYGSGSNGLQNFKALSDTIVYNPGVYKPLFGTKADPALQAVFKIVKNPNVNVSDNEVISSTISAINAFFDTSNWDFGDTFYFSELSTYLHNALAPNVASIIIVPSRTDIAFGGLLQINANSNEIMVSAATPDNVQIINAITAAQINQTLAGLGIVI